MRSKTELGQRIISEIRRLAAEDPDHVYSTPIADGTCVYVHDGQPSCIVGRALWNLGLIGPSFEFDATEVRFTGTSQTTTPNRAKAGLVFDHLGLELSTEERQWINGVQSGQDYGDAWVKAVLAADRTHQVA